MSKVSLQIIDDQHLLEAPNSQKRIHKEEKLVTWQFGLYLQLSREMEQSKSEMTQCPHSGSNLLTSSSVIQIYRSDGTQPHYVNIQFLKKMRVQEISLYLDFKTDESYTPSKISVRVGNSFYELQEVKMIEFKEPIGWFTF